MSERNPALPKRRLPEREWATLLEALRWLAKRKKPLRPEYETDMLESPVSFPDKYKLYLLNLMINEGLEARGAPVTRAGTTEDEPDECGDFATVPVDDITWAGLRGIDWANNSLHYDVYETSGDFDYSVQWNAVSVLWAELHKLSTRQSRLSEPRKGRKPGRRPYSVWPLLAALTAILWGSKSSLMINASKKTMLKRLEPLLKAAQGEVPGETRFGENSLSAAEDALELYNGRWSPEHRKPPEWLPLVTALMAIIWNRDDKSGKNSSESERNDRVKLIIESAEYVARDNTPLPSDPEFFDEALEAVKDARRLLDEEQRQKTRHQ